MPDNSIIPDRVNGCYDSTNNKCTWTHNCGPQDSKNCKAKTLKDTRTKELTIAVADELEVLTGSRPHVIINHLKRSKLDANRAKDEATLGNANAIKAFNNFHDFIDTSMKAVESGTIGRGLFLDMHGQSHSEKWIELGYLISGQSLDYATDQQANPISTSTTSIRKLFECEGTPATDLLYGSTTSFGGILQNDEGYKTIPSPLHPGPNNGNYYSGGYNTVEYGSKSGGMIDAIQIKSPFSLRKRRTYADYALKLADAINKFRNLYYTQQAAQKCP